MFFAGRLPRPPWETRGRVQAMVKRLDRIHLNNTGHRFRFDTLVSFSDVCRSVGARPARSRGRAAGTLCSAGASREKKSKRPEDRILHVTTFSNPMQEMDKLHDLYDSLAEARRQSGEEPVPFHKFADLIKTQVAGLKEKGSPEVAFRIALKDGEGKLCGARVTGSQRIAERKKSPARVSMLENTTPGQVVVRGSRLW